MLRQRQHATQAFIPKRRPPEAFTSLLEAPPSEIRKAVAYLCANPLFQQLRIQGIVCRHPFGRVPTGKYQEYMDRQLIVYSQTYDMERRFPGWVEQLADPAGLPLETLAGRFRTPLSETLRLGRYLRADAEDRTLTGPDLETVAATGHARGTDEDGIILGVAAFVERYGIEHDDFRRTFLESPLKQDPINLAKRYGAQAKEIRDIMRLVQSLQLRDAMIDEVSQDSDSTVASEIVGTVSIHPYTGAVIVELVPWAVRCGVFYVDRERIAGPGGALPAPGIEELLQKVECIGQYGSLLRLVIEVIVQRQEDFLISDTAVSKAPLPQAWVATECSVPRSSVCRVIKNKKLRTPHGEIALRDLCVPVGDVVRATGKAHPNWTAGDIARYLQSTHGVSISQRTVAHHRAIGK